MTRSARAAPKNVWKRTDAPARNFGRGCSRIQAREITPSVPSDPINIRSGLGPAPDPAKGRIFETLRKMPQRDAMRLELVFQRWTIDAAFDQRGARCLIHLDDLAE